MVSQGAGANATNAWLSGMSPGGLVSGATAFSAGTGTAEGALDGVAAALLVASAVAEAVAALGGVAVPVAALGAHPAKEATRRTAQAASGSVRSAERIRISDLFRRTAYETQSRRAAMRA